MAFVIVCVCIRVDSVFIGGSIPTTAFDLLKIDMETFGAKLVLTKVKVKYCISS